MSISSKMLLCSFLICNFYRKKREKYEESLKKVNILSTIEHYEMMKIVDALNPVEYKAGDTIIKEVIREIKKL